MKKRMLIMLVAVGLVFGGIFGWQAIKARFIRQYFASQGVPTETVSTIEAAYQTWQPTLEAVGTLRALRGADLAAEVAGVVSAIHFRSGDGVKAGAPLVQLDDATDVAHLESLQASAQLAETTYKRDLEQLKAKFISQAAVDTDAAKLRSARASVEEQKAVIAKKLVRAPFAGRLGIRAVDLGQYVAAGTKLVTLQSLDPILVDFSVPQSELARVGAGQQVMVTSGALPGERFEGAVSALDAKLDPSTRNVLVRASLGNPQQHLLPGMFVNVQIHSGTAQRYLTLPQTAITFNPYGDTVFVVEKKEGKEGGKPQLVATQRFVTTGPRRGDQIAVLSGVKEGETVVSAGQLKLRNGTPVRINNSVQPSNEASPRPQEK